MESDTIVAMVTPPGEGGVGIVRVSGPLATSLPGRLFPRIGSRWESHRLRQGELVDPRTETRLDQAMAVVMHGPHSFTGEDVLEIHLHGNPLLLERVTEVCLAEGCRTARPGEFSLRAFLNGRLDLSQAEAVMDVVRARTNAGLELAVQQLNGWLSGQVEPLRHRLVGVLAHMEAMVDFVEEDIPPQLDDATQRQLQVTQAAVETLLHGIEQGAILREGATLCLVGSPNVGKSSIMNGLLGMNRSIVTPVPGTTRDTVEEMLQIRGVPFRVVDTAGITETGDLVELIGVQRSRTSLDGADVILLVLDRSRGVTRSDHLALDAVRHTLDTARDQGRHPRVVVTWNKTDLPASPAPPVQYPDDWMIVASSAVEIGGLDALREALAEAVLGETREAIVAGNVRHRDALRRAAGALDTALTGLASGTPLDLVSFDVRMACSALGEITGADVDDELLDRIFREFCIGK